MNSREWLDRHERLHKETLEAWVEWAQNAKISESVLQWVKDNPQVLQDTTTTTTNPYIFPLSVTDYIINEKLNKE
jgi:hypothetical protein